MKVPEIEQRLVDHGLTPEAATSVVTNAIEDRIHEEAKPKERVWRPVLLHRILSGALVAGGIIFSFSKGGIGLAISLLAVVLLPLPLVWFAEEMESTKWVTGLVGIWSLKVPFTTPAGFLRLLGWLILVLSLCGFFGFS
jgi:hypothetical protein